MVTTRSPDQRVLILWLSSARPRGLKGILENHLSNPLRWD